MKVQGVSPEKFNKMFRSKSPKRVANNEKKSRMINSKSDQEQPDPIMGYIRRRSFLYTKFVKNNYTMSIKASNDAPKPTTQSLMKPTALKQSNFIKQQISQLPQGPTSTLQPPGIKIGSSRNKVSTNSQQASAP